MVALAGCGEEAKSPNGAVSNDYKGLEVTHIQIDGRPYNCVTNNGYSRGGVWCERA